MRRFFCFLLLLCLNFWVAGQGKRINNNDSNSNNDNKAGLGIGDQVPGRVMNSVAGLRKAGPGQLVILDFWATWCAPCRMMVPVLDSLQRVFGDKIAIVPVAYESRSVAAPVLAVIRKRHGGLVVGGGETGISVYGDKVLTKLFAHRALPHYVWIRSGMVLAITGYEQVTGANIVSLLGEHGPALEQKKDSVAAYDAARPLLVAGNGGNGNTLLYHALLSGYTPGIPGGYSIHPADSNGRMITARNLSIAGLYQLAFGEDKRVIGKNRLVLEVRDTDALSSRAHGRAYIRWMQQRHAFSYEILAPPQLAGRAYQLMQEDLARLFPAYTARMETRRVPCLVLQRTSGEDKLKSKGGPPRIEAGAFGASLVDVPLSYLTARLRTVYLQNEPPLVDDTGYAGPVDLNIQAGLSDVAGLNNELAKYDLRLVREEHPVELLVIKDKP